MIGLVISISIVSQAAYKTAPSIRKTQFRDEAAVKVKTDWRRPTAPRRPLPVTPVPREMAVPGREGLLPAPSTARPRLHSVPSVMMELFHRGPHDQLQAEIVRSLTPTAVGQSLPLTIRNLTIKPESLLNQ